MDRVWCVQRVGGFVRVISCLGLLCETVVHLSACSSEGATETGTSRSSEDDDADRTDDNADRGNVSEDPNELFTLVEYYRATCDYYTRCSSALRGWYGDKYQCAAYYRGFIDAFLQDTEEQVWQAWDTECLRNLASMDCPSTPLPGREWIEVYLNLNRELVNCLDVDDSPCEDDTFCLTGRCSDHDGKCGICEALPEGQCQSSYDCAIGEVCLDDECAAPKATGADCESAEQCASGHCSEYTCAEAIPEGGGCETTLDCASYLWCQNGKCARPGTAGAACEAGIPLSCQIGYACHENTCQSVGYVGVPVGGLCASTASCVAGASCSLESVCEDTGEECVIDSHCAADHYCDGRCLTKLDLGTACDTHSTCKSAYCSDAGTCAERNTCE